MIVFYNICPMEISDFALRPETLAPVSGSPPQIATQCVPNAGVPGGSDQSISICTNGGIWLQVSGQGCTCNPGFFASLDELSCIGCFAGTYFSQESGECQSCPNNSNSTEQGETECPCFSGFYRAQGEEDLPCELPPSPPRNIRVTAVTENSISVSWDPPASLGGRDEAITYNLTAVSEEATLLARRTILTNATSGSLDNLLPGLSYQVYVIAENGITDQVPDRLVSLAATMSITTDSGISVNVPLIAGTTVSSLIAVILLSVVIIVCVILYKRARQPRNEGENYYDTINLSHVTPPKLPPPNVTVKTKENIAYDNPKKTQIDAPVDMDLQDNAAYKNYQAPPQSQNREADAGHTHGGEDDGGYVVAGDEDGEYEVPAVPSCETQAASYLELIA